MKPGTLLAAFVGLAVVVVLILHLFGFASRDTLMLFLALSTWVYAGDIWYELAAKKADKTRSKETKES